MATTKNDAVKQGLANLQLKNMSAENARIMAQTEQIRATTEGIRNAVDISDVPSDTIQWIRNRLGKVDWSNLASDLPVNIKELFSPFARGQSRGSSIGVNRNSAKSDAHKDRDYDLYLRNFYGFKGNDGKVPMGYDEWYDAVKRRRR